MSFEHAAAWELRPIVTMLTEENETLRATIATLTAERDAALADKAKLTEALEHMQWCRWCSESSWDECDEGKKALELLKETGE